MALHTADRVELTLRGTGSNNHLPAEVKRNSFTILRKDDFRGLYLHVFSRYDLTSVFSGFYDTAGSTSDSNQMATKISSYDSTYLILVVSCNMWEANVTEALIQALENCGAILIKEATLPKERRPYAFIGVPELGRTLGHSRETLRNNKSYYLHDPRETESLPSADLRVVFLRNPWRQFYFMLPFDTWRRYDPNEDYFGSLAYQLNLLLEANETTSANLGFQIMTSYGTFTDQRTEKLTELDNVWAGSAVARYGFDQLIYSDGLDIEKLAWSTAVNSLIEGNTCEAPYTDASNSACYLSAEREAILKCGVGITPWNCAYLGQTQVSVMYT